MAKQNQIIAIEKGVKSKAERALTDAHQRLAKPQLYSGVSRKYTPKDAEGEQQPSELHHVQTTVEKEIDSFISAFVEYYDVVGTKERTNQIANADIEIGDTVLKDVPAGFILFLEKQLANMATFIKGLPVLDPAERWKFDTNQDCYATEPTEQMRTKKVPRSMVVHPGTEHHPPQVQTYTEDIQVGVWDTVKFSGALPAEKRADMIERIESLQKAVKRAREKANMTDVARVKFGHDVMSYIFGIA